MLVIHMLILRVLTANYSFAAVVDWLDQYSFQKVFGVGLTAVLYFGSFASNTRTCAYFKCTCKLSALKMKNVLVVHEISTA